MLHPPSGRLLALLANPPLTSGQRTLDRVALAASLLGYAEFEVANLFPLAYRARGEIATLGRDGRVWEAGRPALVDGLERADAVLLGYGFEDPTGDARHHRRSQVEWLLPQILSRGLCMWQVGDGRRHPSRWQRWTWRQAPDLHFADALAIELRRADGEGESATTRFGSTMHGSAAMARAGTTGLGGR